MKFPMFTPFKSNICTEFKYDLQYGANNFIISEKKKFLALFLYVAFFLYNILQAFRSL